MGHVMFHCYILITSSTEVNIFAFPFETPFCVSKFLCNVPQLRNLKSSNYQLAQIRRKSNGCKQELKSQSQV